MHVRAMVCGDGWVSLSGQVDGGLLGRSMQRFTSCKTTSTIVDLPTCPISCTGMLPPPHPILHPPPTLTRATVVSPSPADCGSCL